MGEKGSVQANSSQVEAQTQKGRGIVIKIIDNYLTCLMSAHTQRPCKHPSKKCVCAGSLVCIYRGFFQSFGCLSPGLWPRRKRIKMIFHRQLIDGCFTNYVSHIPKAFANFSKQTETFTSSLGE